MSDATRQPDDVSRASLSGDAQFLAQVTNAQSSLYAFICSLLGNSEDSRDVLQNTNLVIWEKADEFDRSRDFKPWAFRIAYLQVMAFRKTQSRDRLIFDDAFMGEMAEEVARRSENAEDRLEALGRCMDRLPPLHQQIIRKRYMRSMSVENIAEQLGQKANSVSAMLYRVRKALANCVEKALTSGGDG